jgi:hypothetical protein
LIEEVKRHPQMKLLEEPKELPFDREGNLSFDW